ncbi:MAG: glycosyltransferase [Verrucomicrobiales bacterium]
MPAALAQAASPLRLLTVAPTSSHPPMMGDAKRIHRLARGFLRNGVSNVYVGKDFIYRCDEDVQQIAARKFREWPRALTGIEALLRCGHYNEVKHCTRRWLNFVRPHLANPAYNAVYCHFLFTYPLIASLIRQRPLVIDTHNSEWEWYDSFAKSSRNPLIGQVCRFSKNRASAIMRELPRGTLMAHVSESDAAAYRERRPDLSHIVVPNGGDLEPRQRTPNYQAPRKKLLFFASLYGKMSYDALRHLATSFWPLLEDHVDVIIAGAHPSGAIQELCREHDWELRENLTEEQVTAVFEEAHFSILPFTYGAGSKLKFFDACMRGVPVLSTTHGACGQDSPPAFATISDDPIAWRDRILSTMSLAPDWRAQVEKFGETFNWTSIAGRMIGPLEERLAELRGTAPQAATAGM